MARREKKSKINLKVWVPIICILVVGITFYMLHDIKSKIQKMEDENTTNTYNDINEEQQEPENSLEANNTEENITDNQLANATMNQANTAANTNKNQSSAPTQPGVTDQKQKAIELVKKELGEDNTVNYVFDYVNENGEYVIAVKDKSSATVKYYFRVNLETQTVELD